MAHQLRIALLALFLGATAMVGWNFIAQRDRVYQSNVPGIDPGNPLAEFGIESAEHKAYVNAKIRNIEYQALQLETGVITITAFLWLLLPIFTHEVKTKSQA
ncbi:MAG: hypothetical protein JO199_10330 [Candidatus Eremiobacteraeota bacterium]|nr:hypothetical protein [Candidatus Eremiobacteraeota bacterium]